MPYKRRRQNVGQRAEHSIRGAGFDQLGLYAVQGPGLAATDLEGRMLDPTKRAQLLDLIRSVEQEPTLLGASTHFVVAATK